MSCTALNMNMANVKLLSTEAAGWSMGWIRWKGNHWQGWSQHQVVLGSCFVSNSTLSLCEAPGELLPYLDYEFFATLSYRLSVSGKFGLRVHEVREVGPLCHNGVWLLVGASWYYCGRNSEGGRGLGSQKAGMQVAEFSLWKSNCSFKAWNYLGGFLSFFLSLETRTLAAESCLPDCRSWMAAVFGFCQTLAINNFEMLTAQSLAFLHWWDRQAELGGGRHQSSPAQCTSCWLMVVSLYFIESVAEMPKVVEPQ